MAFLLLLLLLQMELGDCLLFILAKGSKYRSGSVFVMGIGEMPIQLITLLLACHSDSYVTSSVSLFTHR